MTNTVRRALLVIDVQNDYIGGNFPIEYPPVQESLAKIDHAMEVAKTAAIPIVAVKHIAPAASPILATASPGGELHEIVRSRGWNLLIGKERASAFDGTELADWLKQQNINTLTFVGYMTHNCVFQGAIDAFNRGFSVEVLADATGSLPYKNKAGEASAEEMHRSFLVVLQSGFAAVMSSDEWIKNVLDGSLSERDNIYISNLRARKMQV
ncbi:MAG: cysteine hydrolase [Proteobacteria bacterium]|nr:cysteine hydrolase [Pseudomonadota bacterium]